MAASIPQGWISKAIKIKSHQMESAGKTDDDKMQTRGNNLADALALKAEFLHKAPGAALKAGVDLCIRDAKDLCKLIGQVMPLFPWGMQKHERIPSSRPAKVPGTSRVAEEDKHQWKLY